MKIIELLLGNFEELKFAKRIFKQDLRTRQISASFVENAAAGGQGLWERAVSIGVKDSGKGRSFYFAFPMTRCVELKSLQSILITYSGSRARLTRFEAAEIFNSQNDVWLSCLKVTFKETI